LILQHLREKQKTIGQYRATCLKINHVAQPVPQAPPRLHCGHPEESRSGELEERKKNWKRCNCPIFASGTLRKKFRRQTTAVGMGDAKPLRAMGNQTFMDWRSHRAGAIAGTAKSKRTTIERAVKVFLASFAKPPPYHA